MKLYATVNSEGAGREAKKGGNKELVIKLKRGNVETFTVVMKEQTLLIYDSQTLKYLLALRTDEGGKVHRDVMEEETKGKTRQGEKIACENHAYFREDCAYCRREN